MWRKLLALLVPHPLLRAECLTQGQGPEDLHGFFQEGIQVALLEAARLYDGEHPLYEATPSVALRPEAGASQLDTVT